MVSETEVNDDDDVVTPTSVWVLQETVAYEGAELLGVFLSPESCLARIRASFAVTHEGKDWTVFQREGLPEGLAEFVGEVEGNSYSRRFYSAEEYTLSELT